jgi:hypothetical protein
MDFGGLLEGLLANRNNPFMGGGGLPPIKTNMAPPENFWEGNKFHIGAPGMQATPPPQAQHQQPSPAPQPVPPTVGVGGGAMMPGGTPPNPFIQPAMREQGTLTLGETVTTPPSLPATMRNRVPYIDPSTVQLAPSAADPYDDGTGKNGVQGYGKNPFMKGIMR